MDKERINLIKKNLFQTKYEDDDEISNTCKKSQRDERVYKSIMRFNAKTTEVNKNTKQNEGIKQQTSDLLNRKICKKENEDPKHTTCNWKVGQEIKQHEVTTEGEVQNEGIKQQTSDILNQKICKKENEDAKCDQTTCNSKVGQEIKQNGVMTEGEVQLLTRKRKKEPEKWQRNVLKRKREAGEEYINIKGLTKKKKTVQPGCEITCIYKCSTNFSDIMREEINKLFYSLNDDQKYKFYNEYTVRNEALRKRTQKENSRRQYSYEYYFPNSNNKERVCKKFFLTTLDISDRRIYHFYKRKEMVSTKIAPTPKKGKHVKKQTQPQKIEEVINHIGSFPIQESHYCRASTKRQYLDPSLSVAKMYSLYVEKHKEPVKEHMYRKIFNEKFNFSFHKPKKDRCDICCEHKAILNPDENQEKKYNDHMIRKSEGDKERANDRLINPKNTTTAVITFDLENIFSLPKADVSCFYYTSKLTVYNLTGHCNVDNSATNALWDETRYGRNGDDIASALIKILVTVVANLPTNITKLILWSDSCVPQNKNSHMSMALITFLQSEKAKNIIEIEQKFSEPGHGNVQEVDTVHSVIERNIRHQEIYSPLGLMRALLKINSTIKLNFMQMLDTDFYFYHEEALKFGFGQIPYTKVKSIKYNKSQWHIVEYKTSFTGTAILKDIRQKKINILHDVMIKKATNSLSDKKIHDIRSLYKYMPTEDKTFMEAILKKVKTEIKPKNRMEMMECQNKTQKVTAKEEKNNKKKKLSKK